MPESPSISFITTCKGRLQHLMQTLPAMATQPGTETIVVDYDCPDGSADWVAANFPAVRVIRAAQQPIFNAARARNLGAAAAKAPWFCFVDADTLLHPDFAASVLAVASPGAYYQCVHGRNELIGTIVLPQAAFARVQGYDEIEAEVITAQAAGRIATYSLSSGWRKFIPNHQVERILTVRVRPDSARTSGDAS